MSFYLLGMTLFLIGCSVGSLTMWQHFHRAKLIRNREEWERAQREDK